MLAEREPRPRLLGAYDPLLHGWVSREAILGEHAGKVVSGGVFRPFALVGGRAVATSTLERGRVLIHPFAAFDEVALRAEVADVERFVGRAAESPRMKRSPSAH